MQRFASSLSRPVASSFSRSTFYRAMSVQASQIKEHQMLHDKDGKEVAKIDHMQGTDTIKLTRDSTGGDVHHLIPLSWATKVEDNKVYISKTAEECRSQWKAGKE